MKESVGEYSKYLVASLLAHGLLLAFLLLGMESRFNAGLKSANPVEIVEAVVIDEEKVTEEVNRLQTEEQQQKVANEAQQKKLTQKLEEVKRAREVEQAKFEKLKQDMAKAKIEEQERLAEIKLVKEKEKKQLEELKQEKEKEKKRLAALDDQRQAEQDRVKQMRIEREKEEKKRLDATKQQQAAKQKAEGAKRLATAKAAKEAGRVAAEGKARAENEAKRVADAWGENVKLNKLSVFGVPPSVECILGITVLPDGSIRVDLVKSSGSSVHDELAKKAAYKTQPFPLPEDPLIREQLKYFTIGIKNDEGMG